MFKQKAGALQGAAMPVTGFNPAEGMIDPALLGGGALQNAGGYDKWKALSDFGAGMSAASAPSAMPVSFGQALAGGNQAMQAGEDRALNRMKTQAEIGSLGSKGADLEKQAQNVFIKQKMGLPLSPQDEAIAKAYDAFQGSKMQTTTMPDQTIRQVPTYRPVFGSQGGTPPSQSRTPQAQQMSPQERLMQLRMMRQQQMGQ
ncbi:MAG: hypothetical protein ACO35I_05230 [Burkholderiaceae bacterium]